MGGAELRAIAQSLAADTETWFAQHDNH